MNKNKECTSSQHTEWSTSSQICRGPKINMIQWFVQDIISNGKSKRFLFLSSQYLPVHVHENHACLCDNGVFFEVQVLKVRVHVEALGAKMECTTNVWNDALSLLSNECSSHPHVPVPLLAHETCVLYISAK